MSRASLGKAFDGQTHYPLPPWITLFSGVPKSGGALTAHVMNEGIPTMVSAAAFWRNGAFQSDFTCNLHEVRPLFLDSAGFTAMALWAKKGPQPGFAGVYPWTIDQYLELAVDLAPSLYSQPDACCEAEIASDRDQVEWRMKLTATALYATLEQVYVWQAEHAKSGDHPQNLIPPPVPIVQGRTPDDYLRALDMLMDVWSHFQPWLADPILIGVGSVCRRSLGGPEGLLPVVEALGQRLPEGCRLHLFGVKSSALDALRHLPFVASTDSMAWDLQARRSALSEGRSNTMDRRIRALDHWRAKQLSRLDAA